MTTRFELYNNALALLNEPVLSSLSEGRASRRKLDKVWNSGKGFVSLVLELGAYNVFERRIQSIADTSITTNFGYKYAHAKPSDWVRTTALAYDEYMRNGDIKYDDKKDYLYSDSSEIYWAYVSNDENYGGDLSSWSSSLTDYASHEFAARTALAISGSIFLKDELEKKALVMRRDVRAIDAINNAPSPRGRSSWVNSRRGL